MKLPILGIDISKEWFDVHILGTSTSERFEYTEKGMRLLTKSLRKQKVKQARVCMEATGLYFEQLADFLHSTGFEVVVVNPQCIKAYACSKLRRSKSDPLDAALCAKYCDVHYDDLHLWEPMPETQKHVRELLRRRESLMQERTAEKNRLQSKFSCPQTIDSIKRTIAHLETEILQLEGAAFAIIDQDPEFKNFVDLVDTIKGISRLTAATILAEVPQTLRTGRLAAAFAGLIPRQESSGKSRKRSYLSRISNTHVRYALYMPAVSAIQCNPVLQDIYDRLLKRGLAKKQALTAVMRKMLYLIFGVLKTQSPFDPQHENKRRALKVAAQISG